MLWVRSTFFALIGPGTVLIAVPVWLLSATQERLQLGFVRWVGLPLILLGGVGLLWCIWDFGHRGKGTLAPIDAPRFIVSGGLYRFVRNPMYVSVLTALIGEALLFQSGWLFAWTALVAMWFYTYVLVGEEPRLARQFGDSYEQYRRAVPRWLPRRPRG